MNNFKLNSLNDLFILCNKVATNNKVIIKSNFGSNKSLSSNLDFDLNKSNNFLIKSRFNVYYSIF